ncbi:TIGR04222 domain-containing membrane protein [Streptomyces sp. NPDC000410]|uniref:TIGR04222 domain-containing membrane protein n=1 Tax=Streptomyces sp. NPDC000410 TaxID=3154254 RepID=UPI0033168969
MYTMLNVLAVLVTIAAAVSSTLLISGLAAARRSGPRGSVHDLMEVAFLNGGPARVVDSALAAMTENGRLAVGGPGIVSVQRPEAHDPVERAVLQEAAAAPNGALHHLRLAVMRSPAVQEIGDGLAARGLMIPPGALRPWRRRAIAQAVCSALLLPVSIVLTVVQYTVGEDAEWSIPFIVKILPAAFAGLLVGLICMANARARVTGAGKRAVARYRAAYAHASGAGPLVALGGLRALPDPVLYGQLVAASGMVRTGQARTTSTSDSSSTHAPALVVVWCASSEPGSDGSGGGGCGGASGSDGGGGGSSCGSSSGGGSSCGSSSGGGGSSCGGGGCGGGS